MEGKKAYRFSGNMGLVTYKTHLNKAEYTTWLQDKVFKKKKITFLRLAHETGDETTPYLHTHVMFIIERKHDSKNCRWLDYNNIHPNIQIIRNHWRDIKRAAVYLSKEDKENEDLKTIPDNCNKLNPFVADKVAEDEDGNAIDNQVERVWRAPNLTEACKRVAGEDLRLISSVKTAWDMKTREVKRYAEEIPDWDWQVDLMDEICGESTIKSRRQVIWITNFAGAIGKTTLCRYLAIEEPNKWMYSKHMGNSRDAATTIKGAIDNGWNGHGSIIDIPRCGKNNKELYEIIESLKDGYVTTQKYAGQNIPFTRGWTVVFSNWLPIFKNLSMDRWDFRIAKRNAKGEIIVTKIPMTHEIWAGIKEITMDELVDEEQVGGVLSDKSVLPNDSLMYGALNKETVTYEDHEEVIDDWLLCPDIDMLIDAPMNNSIEYMF